MANSPNKGYTLQATNTNSGTWGANLNTDMIEVVDLNVGGTYALDTSSPGGVAPNGTFTVSSPNNKNAILYLSGNPNYAAWTNITITINDLNGFLFVQNNITLNGSAYPQIRIKNSANATYAVVPAKTQTVLISDSSNGVRLAAQYDGFVSGTTMTFVQASAPTGWTKSTTAAYDNAALRIVTGASGGATAGTANFTTAFANRTIAQANLPSITLNTDSQGNHSHLLIENSDTSNFNSLTSNKFIHKSFFYTSGSSPYNYGLQGSNSSPDVGRSSTTGLHTHSVPLGGSGTPLDFAVKYIDTIVCTKD